MKDHIRPAFELIHGLCYIIDTKEEAIAYKVVAPSSSKACFHRASDKCIKLFIADESMKN